MVRFQLGSHDGGEVAAADGESQRSPVSSDLECGGSRHWRWFCFAVVRQTRTEHLDTLFEDRSR